VYFQIIWNVLREPMQRALEALVMERQTESKATFPPFAQQLIDRGMREGRREGELAGELKGELKGRIEGKRDALLRVLARAGIALNEDERARIQVCADAAILDHWIDNVIGAKTAADVLS
jgi:predicted transposase YdaD